MSTLHTRLDFDLPVPPLDRLLITTIYRNQAPQGIDALIEGFNQLRHYRIGRGSSHIWIHDERSNTRTAVVYF